MNLKNKNNEDNKLKKIQSGSSINTRRNFLIRNIKISKFRNYDNLILNLGEQPIVLYGRNGVGKTNILEAISFLGPGRGLRKAKSQDIFSFSLSKVTEENISWGVNADVITPEGCFNIGSGSILNKKSRIVKINTIERSQIELSKIIKISWITPQMLLLFHTNMREKRQFIDRLVNYLNPTHISYIYKFEKLVRERSKILMDFTYDELWVDSLEKNIVDLAILIIKNRNELISEVNKINNKKMNSVGDSFFPIVKLGLEGEAEELFFSNNESEYKGKFIKILKDNRKNNCLFFPGPHKTAVNIINVKSNKEISLCSTGEQKIMLISLILHHSKLLEEHHNSPPILLLDDIVEHLDFNHKEALFKEISKYKAQCWFTSTDLKFFESFPTPYEAISVDELKSTPNYYSKELIYA